MAGIKCISCGKMIEVQGGESIVCPFCGKEQAVPHVIEVDFGESAAKRKEAFESKRRQALETAKKQQEEKKRVEDLRKKREKTARIFQIAGGVLLVLAIGGWFILNL